MIIICPKPWYYLGPFCSNLYASIATVDKHSKMCDLDPYNSPSSESESDEPEIDQPENVESDQLDVAEHSEEGGSNLDS